MVVSHEELGQSLIIDVSGIQDGQVLMLGIEETLHGLLGIVKLLAHVLLVVISLSYSNTYANCGQYFVDDTYVYYLLMM